MKKKIYRFINSFKINKVINYIFIININIINLFNI